MVGVENFTCFWKVDLSLLRTLQGSSTNQSKYVLNNGVQPPSQEYAQTEPALSALPFDLGRHFCLVDFFSQLFNFAPFPVLLAQLFLNGFQLFAQEILALGLIHRFLGLIADFLLSSSNSICANFSETLWARASGRGSPGSLASRRTEGPRWKQRHRLRIRDLQSFRSSISVRSRVQGTTTRLWLLLDADARFSPRTLSSAVLFFHHCDTSNQERIGLKEFSDLKRRRP